MNSKGRYVLFLYLSGPNLYIMKQIFTFIAACCSLLAVAQPAGWSFVVPLDITNPNGLQVTNYQVGITLNTATPIGAGQMQATGADIRFGNNCSGSTLYNYWIESGINTANTLIWVKVDTLPANATKRIFLYYGNSAATAVSAVPGTFFGPHSSTDSVASGGAGGATNSQRGFRFSPNQDLIVTHFGKREPNGTTRYVTLFNQTTQAIIAQTQVAGPAAQYSYGALPTPIRLVTAQQYSLQLYQGSADGYYFGASSQIGQHLTYLDMRYCNSCTQNTFPTSVLGNFHYGYPDMWYFTRNNGLAATPTVAVGAFVAPTVAAIVSNSVICSGDSTSLSAVGSGGVGPYTYAWTPSASLANPASSATNAAPGTTTTYTVTITDACTSTASTTVAVTVNPTPTVSITASSSAICAGDTALLTATSGGTGQWFMNGSPIVGQTSTTLQSTMAGVYNYIKTNTNGCADSAAVGQTITVNALPVVTAAVNTNEVCAGDSVIFNGGGALTYVWSNGIIDNTFYAITQTGYYTVMGVDANGCMNSDSVMVTANALPAANLGADINTCQGTVTLDPQVAGSMYVWNSGDTTQTITTTTAGTYFVTVTDTNGCVNSDTIAVSFNANPVVDLGADTTVCGDAVIMNAQNPGATYLWSTGDTTQQSAAVASGVYTVMVTDSNGCSASDTILVTINALPSVVASAAATTVCIDDANVMLTGTPAAGTWSGPGVSGNSFDPSVGIGTQSLTYSFTDANGCTNTDDVAIQVNACVGVEENAGVAALEVYPVPFNQSVNLINNGSEPVTVIVYAADGRVVKQLQLMSGRTELNTAAWSNGFYFLQTPGSTIKLLKSE